MQYLPLDRSVERLVVQNVNLERVWCKYFVSGDWFVQSFVSVFLFELCLNWSFFYLFILYTLILNTS